MQEIGLAKMSEVTKKVKKWQLLKPDEAPQRDSSYIYLN